MIEETNQDNDDKIQEQEDHPSHTSRRQILTGVLAGGVVTATAWHKPVINAVMLPAHAQTSADADSDADQDVDQDTNQDVDQDTDQDVDDTVTDDQQTTLVDFFATAADATEVGAVGQIFLNALIPTANALAPTNELPLSDLKFEAEALDQGGGVYKMRIAAERIADQNGRQIVSARDFVFGWEGTISNLNTASVLTGPGCAQNESGQITALSTTSLSLEMSYFNRTIQLILDAGSTSLPTFPLNCV